MKRALVFALLASAAASPALAQRGENLVDEVVVVAPSPIGAAAIPVEDIPAAVNTLAADDLQRTGPRSILRALGESVGQVSINGAQANPFQPNVLFRGFEASPLAGNAQGLAVYVDGGRFNLPFGDTVNWDLIPEAAIHSLTVAGSNPVFGLNALGGSLDVRLKTGATFQGLGAEVSAGSFGRRDGSVEWGAEHGSTSAYVALRALEDDGWRDFSPSSLHQGYGNIGWSGEDLRVNLGLLFADNDLTGNGPAPVEILENRRASIFTHPDRTRNRYDRVSLTSAYSPSEAWSLEGELHYQKLRQRTENGDAVEIENCEDDDLEGLLCLEGAGDDVVVTGSGGTPIAAFLDDDGTYALLNRGSTESRGWGASLQFNRSGDLFGRSNRLTLGVSFETAKSRFRASSEVGALSDSRGYQGPGFLVEQDDGAIGSVAVNTTNRYTGLYFSDLLDLTPDLSLTLGGRYNHAEIELRDQIGTALNGSHKFDRFNPSVGVTWKARAGLSLYAGYAEANRAPTPAELSCADENAPCSLTNFFIGDPPLEQVVSHTWEAGVRGSTGRLRWNAGLFRTENDDDIMFVASQILGRAYFQNVGETRRQGGEIELGWASASTSIDVSYAFTEATFQSPLVLNGGENPFADEDGRIYVEPGDEMPGVARHKLKLAADHDLTDRWRVSGSVVYSDGQRLLGDEANQNPKTRPFTVVNVSTSFQLTPQLQMFGAVENLFDAEYETFGAFAPVDEVPVAEVPDISDPRSLSPAPPRAIYVGLRLKL